MAYPDREPNSLRTPGLAPHTSVDPSPVLPRVAGQLGLVATIASAAKSQQLGAMVENKIADDAILNFHTKLNNSESIHPIVIKF